MEKVKRKAVVVFFQGRTLCTSYSKNGRFSFK